MGSEAEQQLVNRNDEQHHQRGYQASLHIEAVIDLFWGDRYTVNRSALTLQVRDSIRLQVVLVLCRDGRSWTIRNLAQGRCNIVLSGGFGTMVRLALKRRVMFQWSHI